MQFSAFIMAAGLSPLWIGMIADARQSYDLALMISPALLIVGAITFLRLPAQPPCAPSA